VFVTYPCTPGHEIVGIVTRIGVEVTKFKIGDAVGVGCLVNSCGSCAECLRGLENYCTGPGGTVWTYSSTDPIDGSDTKGGYSKHIVVKQSYVLTIPAGMDLAKAAPLLCAGITMYSPLKNWQAAPGKKVGIIGVGGLGHMGLKLAKSLGAEVVAISSSPNKSDDARKYGASSVLISTDAEQMEASKNSFQLIIDTIPSTHSVEPYLKLLKLDGDLVLVGPISPMEGFHGSSVMGGRKSITGSGVGGIKETQEMLEYCAKNDIYPDIEIMSAEDINSAWDTMVQKNMSHRYVIDIKNTLN
jgi:alcohol dehydrogenase (NADP+)